MDLNFLTAPSRPIARMISTPTFRGMDDPERLAADPNSKGALNTTQAGDYPYDELGSEASSLNNSDAAARAGARRWMWMRHFCCANTKVRLNTSATQDIHLVVRKLVGGIWDPAL